MHERLIGWKELLVSSCSKQVKNPSTHQQLQKREAMFPKLWASVLGRLSSASAMASASVNLASHTANCTIAPTIRSSASSPSSLSLQRWFTSRVQCKGVTGTRITERVSAAVGVGATFIAVRRSEVLWASPLRKLGDIAGSAKGQTSTSGGIAMSSTEAESSELLNSPVVSVDWLNQHLNDSNVKVLDGSWYMPMDKRNPLQEYKGCHIPNALFFDIDGIIDPISELPHMLPTAKAFASAASALGISNDDSVIVYDGKGIFSAARVWWMFRVFGHEKVWVLDGGLPKWRASNYNVESTTSPDVLEKIESAVGSVKKIYSQEQVPTSTFKAKLQQDLVWSLDQVQSNIGNKEYQVVDARSKGRFDGTAPEPRKGIRGGHVPGSICVPFPEVLTPEGTLLEPSELAAKFSRADVSLESPIVSSCGTGVTACILALALHRLGKKDVPVYDGSWSEWGANSHTPVETTD